MLAEKVPASAASDPITLRDKATQAKLIMKSGNDVPAPLLSSVSSRDNGPELLFWCKGTNLTPVRPYIPGNQPEPDA